MRRELGKHSNFSVKKQQSKQATTHSNTQRKTQLLKLDPSSVQPSQFPNVSPEDIYGRITINENIDANGKKLSFCKLDRKPLVQPLREVYQEPEYLGSLMKDVYYINSLYNDVLVRGAAQLYPSGAKSSQEVTIANYIKRNMDLKEQANRHYHSMLEVLKIAAYLKVPAEQVLEGKLIHQLEIELKEIDTENQRLEAEIKAVQVTRLQTKEILDNKAVCSVKQRELHACIKAIQREKRQIRKLHKEERNVALKLRNNLKSRLKYDRSTTDLKIKYTHLKGQQELQSGPKKIQNNEQKNRSVSLRNIQVR